MTDTQTGVRNFGGHAFPPVVAEANTGRRLCIRPDDLTYLRWMGQVICVSDSRRGIHQIDNALNIEFVEDALFAGHPWCMPIAEGTWVKFGIHRASKEAIHSRKE